MRLWMAFCLSLTQAYAIHERKEAVAGTFYPKDPVVLQNNVLEALVTVPLLGKPLSQSTLLMVPHAGYDFSGYTAASAYKQLLGKTFDHIVLLGPSHTVPLNNAPSVFWKEEVPFWKTPLGRMPIDPIARILAFLLNDPTQDPYAVHAHEHSLEVQLPFLQTLFGKTPIVPILINDPHSAERVVSALLPFFKKKRVLYVLSSDLSHYLPPLVAEKKDRHTLKAVRKGDSLHMHALLQDENSMCGRDAVYAGTLLQKALSLPALTITGYAQSGDRDVLPTDSVVGYGAGITLSPKASPKALHHKNALLSYARDVLISALYDTPLTEARNLDALSPQGVFVTLRIGKDLRGCVGTLVPKGPLKENLAQMTLQAAFGDQRFPPLTKEELDQVTIEISLLSPLLPVTSFRDGVPDQDGVMIESQGKTGVFLPEVWNDMTREAFFTQLCLQKMDLPSTCYKDPNALVHTFYADVFAEPLDW